MTESLERIATLVLVAARAVRADRFVVYLAAGLVFGEAACGGLVREPTEVAVEREARQDEAAGAFEVEIHARSGSLAPVDGVLVVLGARTLTGAEKIGALIGVWLVALPAGLLFVGLIGAWLRPGYYRRQRGAFGGAIALGGGAKDARPIWKPRKQELAAVLFVWVVTTGAEIAAGCLAALPGLLLLLAGAVLDSGVVAGLGMMLMFLGTLGAWLYLHLGWLFADRIAVLEGVGGREAMRRAWRTSDRVPAAGYWVLYALLDLLGALAWIAGPIGALLHAPLRALGDTVLTRAYLEAVERG
jgi:hypothetical protein